MKNRVFSGKLYLEGLRRLRTLGIVYVITMMALTVLPGVFQNIGSFAADGWRSGTMLDEDDILVLIISFIVAVPVLTIVQFSFLNKRSSSDFFHSIPESRTCLFTSFSLASYTWAAAGVILPWAARLLTHIAMPKNTVDPCYYAMLPVILTVCLMVEGGILVAMSQTGTLLTNITVSALVLLAPRFVMFAISAVLEQYIPVFVNAIDELPVLDYRYNLLFSFFDWDWDNIGIAHIYSILLAIAYFAIALFLFNKRRSETAEQSAQNNVIQCAVRTILAFCFCLPGLVAVNDGELSEDVIIFFALALIAYFAYEAITKRSFRTFGKAAWQLCFLATLCVLMFVIPNTVMLSVARNTPKEENVENVSVQTGRYKSIEEYYAKDVVCTSEKVIHSLTAAAQKNAKEMVAHSPISGSQWMDVDFLMKDGSVVKRSVRVGISEKNAIIEAIERDPAYIDAIIKKPAYEEIFELFSDGFATEEQRKELYETFLEDYNALSREEKQQYLNLAGQQSQVISDIYVSIDKAVNTSYPIVPRYTPKTANLCVKTKNEAYADQIKELLSADIKWYYINLNMGDGYHQYHGHTSRESDVAVLDEIKTLVRNTDNAKEYITLDITFGTGDDVVLDGDMLSFENADLGAGTYMSILIPAPEGDWYKNLKSLSNVKEI